MCVCARACTCICVCVRACLCMSERACVYVCVSTSRNPFHFEICAIFILSNWIKPTRQLHSCSNTPFSVFALTHALALSEVLFLLLLSSLCVFAIRIVSMDKILRITNTFHYYYLLISKSSKRNHQLINAYYLLISKSSRL